MIFKRIRNAWALRNADVLDVSGLSITEIDEKIQTLKPSHINFGEGMVFPVEGDGKAVFIGPGTEQEYKDQQNADSGMAGWYERLKNL